MPGEYIALVAVMMVLGIPLSAIWTNPGRTMEQIRQQTNRLRADDIKAEFEAVREEIRDLRDTSMQYDLSFDTALHQIERRLAHLERPKLNSHVDADDLNVNVGG